MGKKNYKQTDISNAKTAILGIDNLLVLNDENNEHCYHTIHKQYFNKEKKQCPACLSDKTRSSKVTIRKFKDIIECDKDFKVVDLFFHQRWFRCNNCKKSVFPEDIDFAVKGCRYTNRLADRLADGTLRYSYKKVCDYYGVPASTASVGSIMRRRIQYRESQFPPLDTPHTLAIIEFSYFREIYPLILGISDSGIHCMDILSDASEATYVTFFRLLNSSKLKRIYIEPNEELKNAIAICFPSLHPLISQECVNRHARNAFLEIVHSDGKRFPIVHKDYVLTQNHKFITSERTRKQIKLGMSSRQRLSLAYEQYQYLLEIFEDTWDYARLSAWSAAINKDLLEFENLIDVIEFYEVEIQNSLKLDIQLPDNFAAIVLGICDAIQDMPHCIFDVLRARCMLSTPYDTIVENDIQKRLGVPADRFIENIKTITNNIKEDQEYEF